MRAVLERDFLAESSGGRSFRSRTYLGLVVAMAVTIVLFVLRDQLLEAPDKVAMTVFRTGATVVVCMLALLAPAAVVGSILNERASETLPLVLATPVGPLGFALAKFTARVGVVLTWGLAALLPLGFTVMLGGVGIGEVLAFVALCTAVVVELAGWSLWISCASRRPATAAILSYLLPAARWAGCWLLGVLLSPVDRVTGSLFFRSTPIPAFLDIADPGTGTQVMVAYARARSFGGPRPGPAPPWATVDALLMYGAIAILLAGLFVLFSALRLRRESEPPRSRGSSKARPGKPRRLRGLPPAGNPLAWKEGRMLNTGTSRPLYYLLLATMLVAEILYWNTHWELGGRFGSAEPWERFWITRGFLQVLAAFVTAIALVCAINGAASVSFERTQGTWDLLRASPLTAAQVARGKGLGVLRGAAFLSIFPLLHLALGWWNGMLLTAWTAVVGVLVGAILLGFWTVVGLRCGARAANPGRALFAAVLTFACFFVGLSLFAGLFSGYWSERILGPQPAAAAGAGNPWWTLSDLLFWMEYPEGVEMYWWRGSAKEDVVRAARWSAAWAVGLLVAISVLFGRLVRRLETESA